MTSKQRDVVFQRWSGEIRRETRDFASLETIGARAMTDSDVRDDDSLQAMIRSLLQQRRDELDQELRYEKASTAPPPVQPKRRSTSASISVRYSSPIPTEDIRAGFNRLALSLCESLERGSEIGGIFEKMRTLQEANPQLIPAAVLVEYELRIEALRARRERLCERIIELTQEGLIASRSGNEPELGRVTRELTAIQAAHPSLPSEAGLERIRVEARRAADERSRAAAERSRAADERNHQHSTTRKVLERQQAVTAEIGKLAAAVQEFRNAACTMPAGGEELREAEAAYLRTIREVRFYDTEWFTGVVLEMADLMAEWTLPPLGAESQIDRFLALQR